MALGATIIAVPRFVPEEVVGSIEQARATVFLGVPSMYAVFASLPAGRKPDFSSLRFCVSGGAPLPQEVMERFESRYGVLIYEGDGPTECSPVTCVNPLHGVRKPGSVGPSVPDVEIAAFDDAGSRLGPDAVGEICVRGPRDEGVLGAAGGDRGELLRRLGPHRRYWVRRRGRLRVPGASPCATTRRARTPATSASPCPRCRT